MRRIGERLSGWRLTAILALAVGLMAMGLAASHHFDVDGMRLVIRATARTSLLLFCLAFSAAALYRCWPNGWTRWQRQNRRYIGVAFAFSHAVHALGIAGFALLDPVQFGRHANLVTFIGGGIAYIFIAAMAATSFDRTAAWLGARAWKTLHWIGTHYIWLVFLFSTGRRALVNPVYWAPTGLLLAVMAVRLLAAYRTKHGAGDPKISTQAVTKPISR